MLESKNVKNLKIKIILCLFVFLTAFLAVFYSWPLAQESVLFSMFSPVEQPLKEAVSLHLYNNEQVSINEVLIRVYYCVTEDGEGFVIEGWQGLISNTLGKINEFYELQFAFNMKMDFKIHPEVLTLSQDTNYFLDLIAKDYQQELLHPHSESQTLKEVINELEEKVSKKGDWGLSLKTINDAHVLNLFVLVFDVNTFKAQDVKVAGLNDESNNSLVFFVGFTDKDLKGFYGSVIAHEIGHALGIPEFYGYEGEGVQSYGLMGAGFKRKLEDNYLEHYIKEKMQSR